MPRHLLFSLLILAFPACGEIELPTDDDGAAAAGSENTQKPDADDEKPGDEKPGDEKPDDEKPDEEKPDDEKPDDEEPDEEKDDNTGGGSTTTEEITIYGTHSVITTDGHLLIEGQFYFALHEFYPVMSVFAEPERLANYVESYSEGNLENWRIPTVEEARCLRNLFETNNINDKTYSLYWLNLALANIQGDRLDISARYLCEDGTKTFRFYPNTNITKAGSKTKYRLRLVHD